MPSNQPLVSIVIPCFNAEDCVGRAIESALAQTYPNVEVIVIDDGSTDGSLAVIRSFGDRVRWETGPNRGGCAARNRGIELARGEMIQFLDADDTLHPNKLEVQVPAALQFRPNVVYCDVERIGLNGAKEVVAVDSTGVDSLELTLFNDILTPGPLHWKSLLEGVGGFCVGLPCGQEWDLHVRLACHGVDFHRLPVALCTYYKQPGSVSAIVFRCTQTCIMATREIYVQLREDGALTDRRAEMLATRMAMCGAAMLKYGERGMAAECFAWARQAHSTGGITKVYGHWTVRAAHRLFGARAGLFAATCRKRFGALVRSRFPRLAQWARPLPKRFE
jgi:hypothetical protein